MTKLDVDFVRKQFPSFQFREVAGNGFFENAGGSFMSKQVIDRLNRYHNQRRVQPYWVFSSSKLAGDEMDESRSRLAALLNISCKLTTFETSQVEISPLKLFASLNM